MSNNDNRRSGRSRGPRRRGGDHRHGDRNRSEREERTERRQEPKKLGFFARILRFFGFGPSESSSSGREVRKEYPAYQGRTGSGSASASEGASDRGGNGEARESRQRAPRKPELLEVTTPKLYVGNLSYDAAESDLFDLFSGVGNVKNAEIVTTKETDRSKGFGFVTMSTIDEAKRAVTELNEKEFMGRRMVVSGSRTTDRGDRADRSDRTEDQAGTTEGEAAA